MSALLTMSGIHAFDGYPGERFWTEESNESTYDDPKVDNQCTIPLPSNDDILEELSKERAETEIN